jgi:hypothetical protein
MDDRTIFMNKVKAVASLVTAFLAAMSHVLGLSPEFATAYFLDLVTSGIMSVAGIFYTVKSREPSA